jgi:bifunctional non-homologous end joining protein LigD
LAKGLSFVIQKHKATSLHYDFRLEIAGKMPSWSVPKGPSLDPSLKRLAMPTGPHELEYRHFEGVIPKGGYGAGPVMIWDQGKYIPEMETGVGSRREVKESREAERVAGESLRAGNLKFSLYGKKLRGSFALVRTRGFGSVKEAWLLIKHKDEFCEPGYDAKDFDYSVKTNRSLAEIADEG